MATKFVRFTRSFTFEGHDKRTRYPAGWSGEVGADVAKAAKKAKALAVMAPQGKAAKTSGPEVTAEADARADKIAEIIEGLPDEAFTQAGLPKTDAIDAVMPEGSEPVSAEERDAVWERMEAEE